MLQLYQQQMNMVSILQQISLKLLKMILIFLLINNFYLELVILILNLKKLKIQVQELFLHFCSQDGKLLLLKQIKKDWLVSNMFGLFQIQLSVYLSQMTVIVMLQSYLVD
mmetsp:Transcript_2469/g.6812  ORF Transcript_2469/g.6812 Transcript_2469/m.6812 type:complete len:110 (-) Transcript_2469:214-543(-)